ncbi:3-hydroxyisobutyrate dehydrogenase related beta-hydroxyacid dehydrogenase [Weissella koreensis KACC 15510]|uniref:NAD(P)-dependent oxidoreductase n=1 Tax=Weissella koreensis TaxID=165096 RepID=UPI0002174931|nr:NAD(P)-dependent oxidoreductase [Weissella koreensis]AEJ23213.1 3-hydroxyisobutyrate dehydrogenase related beta-hydroxyacid dehydrogenase [Weissella koreensis KACC 15510]
MKIGFIGTGVMGTGVIENLLKAGFEVEVFNRTKAHAKKVLDSGAQWVETPKALAMQNDLVITMVGYPDDVKAQYYGENGLFAGASEGKIFMDMTTSTPTLAETLAEDGVKHGVAVLDAPVSGGDVGAREGTLTVMVGGDEQAFNTLAPVFEAIAGRLNLFGNAGLGQHAKMANQIMIAGTMLGMSETLVYAKRVGLNLSDILTTLNGGSAQNWSLENYGPRILSGDFKPGFYAKHLLKDLRIALDEAEKLKLALPMTALAETLYEKLVDEKQLGDEGSQALIKLWWSKA